MDTTTKGEPEVRLGTRARINNIFDKTLDSFEFVAELILVFIMVSITVEVIARYFFGYAIIWTIEVTEYCLLWITFLSTAWVLKKEGHVSVDLIPDRLKPRAKASLLLALSIIATLVCVVYAWFGAAVTIDLIQKGRVLSTVLRPPAYILFAIIPIGNILLVLQFIRRDLGLFKKLKEAWAS